MITALFNYAVDYFNLAENPCHKAGRMGKREVVVNFWTKDEFDRILAAMVLSGKLNDALSGRLFYADFGSHGGNSHFKNGCFCELFS